VYSALAFATLATLGFFTGNFFLATFDLFSLRRFDEQIGGFFFVGFAFPVMVILFTQEEIINDCF
jgi:hypothetical protein